MALEAVFIAVGAIAAVIAVAALTASSYPPAAAAATTPRAPTGRAGQPCRSSRSSSGPAKAASRRTRRLRPLLVEIAEAPLGRRGLRLDGAHDLLGPPVSTRAPRPSSAAGGQPRRRYRAGRARGSARPPGDRCRTSVARAARILDQVERAVIGQRDALELVLLGLLADGHVLIEDNPGLAKTLMARSFAAVDPAWRRLGVRSTPDLMPL